MPLDPEEGAVGRSVDDGVPRIDPDVNFATLNPSQSLKRLTASTTWVPHHAARSLVQAAGHLPFGQGDSDATP